MLRNSIVALVTPLHNNRLDEKALERLVHFHNVSGTDGLVLCGSTGEGNLLSLQERRRIFEIVSQNTDLPLVMACNHVRYEDLLAMTSPDYKTVLVTPPPYIRPTQEGLYAFFERLHNDINSEIIIYNHPGRVSVDMDFETLKALFKLPRIAGYKDSDPDKARHLKKLSALAALYCDTKVLFCGEDLFLKDCIAHGGNGIISVVGNIVPDLVHRLFTEGMGGYDEVDPYIQLLQHGGNPAMVKGIMFVLGMIHNELKFPLMPIKGDLLEKVKGALHDLKSHSSQQTCGV